jgi:AbrB family looped-hinge helix DNA binding protein
MADESGSAMKSSSPPRLVSIDFWYYDTSIDMSAVTVSPKYQIVIPKDLRDRLALQPGDKLELFEIDGRIEIVPRKTLKSLRGFLPGINTSIERGDDRE